VDVDEVAFPFVTEFSRWHNDLYATDVGLQDFHTYEFDQVLGISLPETIARVHAFLEQDHHHLSVDPLDLARESIARLTERYSLVAVTARHPTFRKATDAYLRTHFRDYFQDIVLIGHHGNMEVVRSKVSVCEELGAVALIDDSLTHVTGCAEAGIKGILFGDYVWNQTDKLLPGIVRCTDWSEVAEHFGV